MKKATKPFAEDRGTKWNSRPKKKASPPKLGHERDADPATQSKISEELEKAFNFPSIPLRIDELDYQRRHLDRWLREAYQLCIQSNDDSHHAAYLIFLAARDFCLVLRKVYERRPGLLAGVGSRHDSAPWLLKITEGPEQIEAWLQHLDLAASVAAKFRGEGTQKNPVSAAVAREIRDALLSALGPQDLAIFTSSSTEKGTGKRTRAVVQIERSNESAKKRKESFKKAIGQGDWETAANFALPFQARRGLANEEWRQLVTCVLQNRYGHDYHKNSLFRDITFKQNLDKEGRTQGRQAVFNSIWTSFQGLMQNPDYRFSQFKKPRSRPGKVKSVK